MRVYYPLTWAICMNFNNFLYYRTSKTLDVLNKYYERMFHDLCKNVLTKHFYTEHFSENISQNKMFLQNIFQTIKDIEKVF